MNEEIIKKWGERKHQKIRKLFNRPDFRLDIAEIRKGWDIPENGFKTPKEQWQWEKALWAKQDEYYETEWPKYRELHPLTMTDL